MLIYVPMILCGSILTMKLIFTSYVNSPEFNQPETWLKRIQGYTGILEQLAKSHSVTGIERISYEGEYTQKGVHYFFIRLKSKVVRFPFTLHKLIKKLQPDVVFINGFIFPLQVIQLRLWLGSSVRIILLHRAEKPATGLKRKLQQWADKCIDAYLFASSDFGEMWKQNIDTRKIHTVLQASSVFYPVNRQAARQTLQVEGAPLFLWVGSLNQRKDPITVVKAFLQFAQNCAGAKLYMIYQSDELLQDVKMLLNTDDSIVLVGAIPHDQLLFWYNSADFFITGSHYEGSGVAVVEAMSCGCIPVTTDFSSFIKITGSSGLIYPAGKENELLKLLLKTPGLDLNAARSEVIKQFENELSFAAIDQKIQHLISSL